jgi:hypothetical protein
VISSRKQSSVAACCFDKPPVLAILLLRGQRAPGAANPIPLCLLQRALRHLVICATVAPIRLWLFLFLFFLFLALIFSPSSP